jgi:carboxyl-terminal processing protease
MQALRLTTARYYTPAGRSIQAKGILRDIESLQEVPEEVKARSNEMRGESSLRGHLKADGEERADRNPTFRRKPGMTRRSTSRST